MLLTIIIFLIILSIMVLAHELGHFLVARKFGLIPREFGIGFRPRAYGIYKTEEGKWKTVRGSKEVKDAADTIYSVNWVPLGGFVELGEDEPVANDPNHFNSKPIWQRFFMISAGVIMNVVLAAILISFGFMIGLPQVLDNIRPEALVSGRKIQIVEVQPETPAQIANLKIGDMIVSIDGLEFTDYKKLQNYTDEKTGQELNYKIKRAGEEMNIKIVSEFRPDTGRGGIGIAVVETGLVKYPWYLAVWEGIKTTIFLTWAIIAAFYNLIKGLIVGAGFGAQVAGPVGIAAMTGEMTRMGFVYLLQFTALLSVNLAVINFLPIPALDGGRALFLVIEKIKGSPVKKETEAFIHNLGFTLLMILVLFVTFKDVARFWK